MTLIDDRILRARHLIAMIPILMKAPSRKPPRPGLFWYEPTHRWRKNRSHGGTFNAKELHAHVEKNLTSLQKSARNFIAANPDSEAAEIMKPVVDKFSHALDGQNTYGEILDALTEVDKTHSSKLFTRMRNKFWKLHKLVHEGEEDSDIETTNESGSEQIPFSGYFQYRPTGKWYKTPEHGGGHSEKDFHALVKDTARYIDRALKTISSREHEKPHYKGLITLGNDIESASREIEKLLRGQDTHEQLDELINKIDKRHSSNLFTRVKNKFNALQDVMNAGEDIPNVDKVPRSGVYQFKPTGKWRKKKEFGGEFNESELHDLIDKNITSMEKSIFKLYSEEFSKGHTPPTEGFKPLYDNEYLNLLDMATEDLIESKEGGDKYNTAIDYLEQAKERIPNKAITRLINKAKKLHDLVNDGVDDLEDISFARDDVEDWIVEGTDNPFLPRRMNKVTNELDDIYYNIKSPSFRNLAQQLSNLRTLSQQGQLGDIYNQLDDTASMFLTVKQEIPKKNKKEHRILENAKFLFDGFAEDIERKKRERDGEDPIPRVSKATGMYLEESDDLAIPIDFWTPRIETRGDIEHISEQVSRDLRDTIANVKPEHQSKLQDILENRLPTHVHDKAEWNAVCKSIGKKGYRTGGFCGPDLGIHIGPNSKYTVVAHELGHMIEQQAINPSATKALRARYQHNKKGKGKFITEYSKTHPAEYVAEVFSHYINDPTFLKRIDPEAFEIISKGLAQ